MKFAILRLANGRFGVYVDGVLEYSGTHIEPDDLLDVLGINFDYFFIGDTTFVVEPPSLWREWEDDEDDERVIDDEA